MKGPLLTFATKKSLPPRRAWVIWCKIPPSLHMPCTFPQQISDLCAMAGLGGLLAAVQQLRRAPGPLSDGLATLLLADLEWSPEPSNITSWLWIFSRRFIMLWYVVILASTLQPTLFIINFFLVLASPSPTFGVSIIEYGMFQDWSPSGFGWGWVTVHLQCGNWQKRCWRGRSKRQGTSCLKGPHDLKPFLQLGWSKLWVCLVHDYFVTFITEALCWFSFRFRNAWI